MNRDKTDAVLDRSLHRIAPEIELNEIDRNADLREELDIDSMDFLNLVTVLSKEFGIDIPESDYPKMASYNAMLAYLEASIPATRTNISQDP